MVGRPGLSPDIEAFILAIPIGESGAQVIKLSFLGFIEPRRGSCGALFSATPH